MLICFEGTRDSNLPLLGKNDICQTPSANGRACKLRSSKATTRLLTACRTETPSSPTRNIIIEEKHHHRIETLSHRIIISLLALFFYISTLTSCSRKHAFQHRLIAVAGQHRLAAFSQKGVQHHARSKTVGRSHVSLGQCKSDDRFSSLDDANMSRQTVTCKRDASLSRLLR